MTDAAAFGSMVFSAEGYMKADRKARRAARPKRQASSQEMTENKAPIVGVKRTRSGRVFSDFSHPEHKR